MTPPLLSASFADDDAQVEDATSGVGILTLNHAGLRNGAPTSTSASPGPPHSFEIDPSIPLRFGDGVKHRQEFFARQDENGLTYLPVAPPNLHAHRTASRPSSAAAIPSPMRPAQVPGRPHSAMSMNLPRYSTFQPQPGEPVMMGYPTPMQGQRPLLNPEDEQTRGA